MAGNIEAFEAINKVKIELRMSTKRTRGVGDLVIMVAAHSQAIEIGEAPSLASVSVTCSATGLKTIEAALIHALYLLDARLEGNALAGVAVKKP